MGLRSIAKLTSCFLTVSTLTAFAIAQDATNNLQHPPGYLSAAPGTLGRVSEIGASRLPSLVLIPGLGFGASVFDDFAKRNDQRFHAVAVTLPGYGESAEASGQPRSMAQDPTLNNLRHAAGVETAESNSLGRVRRVGTGPRRMLLIPGLGFGDGIWTEFMERHKTNYTMYAVTLPGFGGTAPLAMPPEGSRFAERPWTTSAIHALRELLDREQINRVTLVAHWALATQIALQLAIDHPDRVEGVVVIGGPLKSYYENPPGMLTWTAAQRAGYADGMGQKWFKTVTRQTWDDNNFMSYDYAVEPRRGLFLWREAQAPSLPVWVRYLLEFYTMDQSASLKNLQVPTLVVQPGFDDPGFQPEPGWNYMRNLCLDSWKGVAGMNPRLEFVTVPESRLFVMFDQPDAVDRALGSFFQRTKP